jgi:hypothetical protein
MIRTFEVYKGLQKPLIYKGFKGKYIFWGLGFLVGGLALGAIVSSTINTYLGALVGISSVVGGIIYTASRQKDGLYNKPRNKNIYTSPITLQRGLSNINRSKLMLLNFLNHVKKESV